MLYVYQLLSKITKINNFFWFKRLNINDQKLDTFTTWKKIWREKKKQK